MKANIYVLQTELKEQDNEIVYLLDKNYHISYITPVAKDALQFETRKQAKKFLEIYKMNLDQWKIVKQK